MVTNGNDVCDLLETRWKRLGYDKLLPVERDYILVWWLQAECSNGTLHQYFYNSAGDNAEDTLAALKRLGASKAYGIFSEAIATFGESRYTADRNERIIRLDLIPDQYVVFQRLTDELFEQSEDVVSLAIDRVGDVYNEQGIEPSNYAQPTKLRLASLVLLVLLVLGAAIITVVMVMAV